MAQRRRGRPRGRTKAETRVRILAAARLCFGRLGYDAATNVLIAEAAGISPGAIYQHFVSKRDLYAAVAADCDRLIADAYAVALMTAEDLRTAMLAVIDVSHDLHERDPTLAQFVFARPMETARHHELATLPRGLDSEALLRSAVQRAASAGEIEPGIALDDVADALWLLIIGLGRYAQAVPDLRQYEEMVGACQVLFSADGPQVPPTTRGSGAGTTAVLDRTAAPTSPTSTRERLVDAAVESFGERGYASTALNDVARRAGLTTGAVYANFPSKQALFVAAVEATDGFVAARLREAVGDDADLCRRTAVYLDATVELAERWPRLIAFRVGVSVEAARDPRLAVGVGDELGRRVAFCRELVETADGMRWLDDRDLALLLVAGGDGAAWFSRFAPRSLGGPVNALKRLLFGELFARPAVASASASRSDADRRPKRGSDPRGKPLWRPAATGEDPASAPRRRRGAAL
jgi:AcrR family transcriptional regulator